MQGFLSYTYFHCLFLLFSLSLSKLACSDHNMQGLLSYTDFHFLLLLMSTPTRYLDIIFRGFDISADGNVEAKVTNKLNINCSQSPINCKQIFSQLSCHKSFGADDGNVGTIALILNGDKKLFCQEFVYVLARISNVKTDPDELMRTAEKSGLIK